MQKRNSTGKELDGVVDKNFSRRQTRFVQLFPKFVGRHFEFIGLENNGSRGTVEKMKFQSWRVEHVDTVVKLGAFRHPCPDAASLSAKAKVLAHFRVLTTKSCSFLWCHMATFPLQNSRNRLQVVGFQSLTHHLTLQGQYFSAHLELTS